MQITFYKQWQTRKRTVNFRLKSNILIFYLHKILENDQFSLTLLLRLNKYRVKCYDCNQGVQKEIS
jgi:hypothetical protein